MTTNVCNRIILLGGVGHLHTSTLFFARHCHDRARVWRCPMLRSCMHEASLRCHLVQVLLTACMTTCTEYPAGVVRGEPPSSHSQSKAVVSDSNRESVHDSSDNWQVDTPSFLLENCLQWQPLQRLLFRDGCLAFSMPVVHEPICEPTRHYITGSTTIFQMRKLSKSLWRYGSYCCPCRRLGHASVVILEVA